MALWAHTHNREKLVLTDYLAVARDALRRAAHTSGSPINVLPNRIAEGSSRFPAERLATTLVPDLRGEPTRESTSATTVGCDRCGYLAVIDFPIHGGQSSRRECARCHRFRGFPRWYGQNLVSKDESDKEQRHED